MESNGSHAKDNKSDSDNAKSKDNTPTTTTTNTPTDTNKSPRKRRKERPCTRCIKRNIGHLCHDEPRDPDAKKPKASHGAAATDESDIQTDMSRTSIDQNGSGMGPPSFNGTGASQGTKPGFGAAALGQANPLHLVSPNAVSGMPANASASNMNQFAGFSDAWLTAQSQFHDMHHYNAQYMLPQEVTHEFNLLNDFLNTSLLDDSGTLPDEQNLLYRNGQSQSQTNQSDMAGFLAGGGNNNLLPPSAIQAGSMPPPNAEQGNAILRPTSATPLDKTREFYLQAADPSGNDTPEARMQRVLKAKYDAGLLKPFNYIKGYARLSSYMDGHIASASKQKILRQLDRFRPKFREKVQGLTDIELVYVEMWFEKTLMEYDRVFAAMAVPACCWRRTGEIFRGNKEMAELIHVPVERLRDGKISLHEILTEESLVRYWEEFGTIAFDAAHDTLLTACALKNPDDRSNDPIVNCCFSFMIRRDDHKMVFSFIILALAQCGDSNTPRGLVRLQKLAIKTGRSYNSQLEFALMALTKAAEYHSSLQNLQDALPCEEASMCRALDSEYLILRMVLSWKEDRLDVADHLYEKINEQKEDLDTTSAESAADCLFEIGKDLATKQDTTLAVKWLGRAYQILDSQELDRLSRDSLELRMAILQALVQSYLSLGTPEGLQKAENHVSYIESEIGDKLFVLLLRLEIILHSPAEVFDCNTYAGIIRRMVKSVDLSNSSFDLIIYHIRKLEDKSPNLACVVLDTFISARVVPSQREEWICRAITLRAHMAVMHRDTTESIEALVALLDGIKASKETPLASATSVAIHTLIWKKIEANFDQGRLDITEKWCRCALHPVLQASGPLNLSRITRKLLLCSLHGNSLESAAEILASMNEDAKSEPMTIYLAYKLGLRNGDRQMISECLENLGSHSSKDLRYLYACCVDAQQTNNRPIAIEALKMLSEKHDLSHPGPIHFPALLRLIIRLGKSILNEDRSDKRDYDVTIEDICRTFEHAVSVLQQAPRNELGNKMFTLDELNWFSKNAYNLGLANLTSWETRQVVRILDCCLAMGACYPSDMPRGEASDLGLRTMFCHFLIAVGLIALARAEDNVEAGLQHYLVMRRHVKSFDSLLESRMGELDEGCLRDLREKLGTLLIFEFEAAICLKS
ncbi:meiosis protein SPO22/ZIP4 like-domain-containing protein [Xylariaceae sp. FL0016]|nr:meiosis protein SPO22/ZIP4 like-domain-containing protein [Xylariaceae sp. FL0016]